MADNKVTVPNLKLVNNYALSNYRDKFFTNSELSNGCTVTAGSASGSLEFTYSPAVVENKYVYVFTEANMTVEDTLRITNIDVTIS